MTRKCSHVLAVAMIAGGLLYQDLKFRIGSGDFMLGGRFSYMNADGGLKEISDVNAVDGDPPLWSYPWITLRGVPALRYQNELAGVLEAELRWNIFTRWAVVAFAGVGATRGDTLIYDDESSIVAGGIGGRYLFRPEDSLWVGVDIAKGPEDAYAYIQVGHAW